MVNKSVLAARLERLREYLEVLEAAQRYDAERFVKDPFIYGAAERHLHLAIECLLDIGNHVISDRGYRKPENYADIFRILAEKDDLPGELCEDLVGMAAFRNVLVHDYLRLDRRRIHEILREKLPVLRRAGRIFSELL
ncbi:MAG: DUF86 domain-containing protein [Saccharofermentanales bacterium]